MDDLGIYIKVLTLNCWGIPYVSKNKDVRMSAISEHLARSEYDIVSLQEIWDVTDFHRIASKVAHILPHSHYFHSGVVGSGVCVFSKWPIEQVFFHQFPLNGYAHMVHHADWFGGKGIGLCKIRLNDITINFYSAHLHAKYCSEDIYLAHRVIQAYDTAEFIRSTSSSADIVFLAGDLNIKPTDLAFKMISTIANLEDSFMCEKSKESCNDKGTSEGAWNSYTDPTEASKLPQGKRIDYILYNFRPIWKMQAIDYKLPISSHVPGENFSYSDHDAVEAQFQVKRVDNGAVRHSNISECLSIMKLGVSICTDALASLANSRYKYSATATIIICVLCFIIPMVDGGAVMAILKIFTFLLLFYCLFMASLWNNMERNAVLSAYTGMTKFIEFHMKHN